MKRQTEFSIKLLSRICVTAFILGHAVFSQQDTAWMSLFNGTDLTGWTYHPDAWYADSGMIRAGEATPFNFNTYIWHDSIFSDFVLKLKGRMIWEEPQYANSGIQLRSYIPNDQYMMVGYQYEIGKSRSGHIRCESCSDKLYDPSQECLDALADSMGWQEMEMGMDGLHAWSSLNGAFCGESFAAGFAWNEKLEGYIGLQYHVPGGFQMDFKDIYIRPLNESFAIPDSAKVYFDAGGVAVRQPGRHIGRRPGMLSARNGELSADWLDAGTDVYVYDRSGRLVLKGAGPRLDVSGLAGGVYVVRAAKGNGVLAVVE